MTVSSTSQDNDGNGNQNKPSGVDTLKRKKNPNGIWEFRSKALVATSFAAAVAWSWWSSTWKPEDSKLWYWLICLAIMALFTFGVGHAITGTWKSLLIDDRNKASLARFQLVLWTALVLSAYATAIAWNRTAGSPSPLEVPMPEELWTVMGISTASLVGSTVIKSDQSSRASILKVATEPMAESVELRRATIMNALDQQNQVPEGQLAANKEPKQARWTDMFKGEGVDNFAYLDIGKLQLFFFSVFLVLLYSAAIGTRFDDHARRYTGESIAAIADAPGASDTEIYQNARLRQERAKEEFQFPGFDEAMIVLLGISHAGYLATKAAHQPAVVP